ncbi:MAG: HlyD family efflux transporter periplasmic adaptor subunit [Leptospiraceae bacterium]|nr:HlyD family efflux transporter periplasmic adaptor subunit [Leptospiraceae bacterium]MCP5497143.1 HlyD family efflux transporter periplasmic adaptor subunit [Leptospiraceae bacterium]
MEFKNSQSTAYQLVQSPDIITNLARILVGLFFLTIVLLIITPWQQTSFGKGRMIAYSPSERQQYIDAPVKGRIIHWYVHEGSFVKKGDPILDISDNDPMYLERLIETRNAILRRIAAGEEQVDAYKSQLGSTGSSILDGVEAGKAKVKVSEQKVISSRNNLEAAEAELETSRLNYDRNKTLFEKGLTSKRNLELAELSFKQSKTKLEKAKADLSAVESQFKMENANLSKVRNEGRAKLDSLRGNYSYSLTNLAKVQEDLQKIETELSRQNAQKITAPKTGMIMRILVRQESEQVKPGSPLAILLPDTENRAVELYVESNDIPLISNGMDVRLQFQGWPVLQISGIPEFSVGTFKGKVSLVDVTDNKNNTFRVLILPAQDSVWPSSKYLRQGVGAKGWILLNRVSLIYELWRLLNNFPPQIPDYNKNEKTNKKGK